MRRRRAAFLGSLVLSLTAAGAWLLPPRIPAPPRWEGTGSGEARLWTRAEEVTPEVPEDGRAVLRLRSAATSIWIESPRELSSAVFLLHGGSGDVSVRSWQRLRWPWARAPSTAAAPPAGAAASRLFLEWQSPRLARRHRDGRFFYRMELSQTGPGEARLTYLGPREVVERPLYQVRWDGCGAPDSVAVDESFLALARLRNESPHPWPGRGNARVRLGYRWLGAGDTGEAAQDLPGPVAPGEALEAWVRVQAPAAPGRYVLELDPVYEPIAWFSEKGAETCRVGLTVR